MANQRALCQALQVRVEEQIERTLHLIERIEPEWIDQAPELPPESYPAPRKIGDLLGHLLECLNGLCGTFYNVRPKQLQRFEALRGLPVNDCCSTDEARSRIEASLEAIRAGFDAIDDADLATILPAPFVADGEPLLARLLINLEHFANHKHELFVFLKLLGARLETRDLYRFQGE